MAFPARGASPYPASSVISGVTFDWSTHQRAAPGSDNFQLTWAANNHQYGWWGDGGGFGGSNSDGRVGLGFARIEGDWNNWQGFNVWGGKNPENPAQFDGKSWGTISVGGVLYSWIVPDVPDTGAPRDHYKYIELARSTNNGATWTKASWRWQITDNLIIPTFLNFGKNNAGARDEYVYSYFIRPQSTNITQSSFGLNVHKPGAVFLARVHTNQIFNGRSSYQWFTGMSGGNPTWGALGAKAPVFQDPEGTGWCLSASYNAGLGRYLLATEHTSSHSCLLGIFDAPEPWGPWTTVKYWTAGDRFGETRPGSALAWNYNVFFMALAPKWTSADGKNFTLTFTGGGGGADNDSFNTLRGTFTLPGGSSPLVGHWAFEGNANDSAGGNNGTLVNSPTFTAGSIGQAVNLNGTSQYISVANSTSINLTTNFSLAAWIRPNSVSVQQGIMTKLTGGNDKQYVLSVGATGQLIFEYEKSGNNYWVQGGTLTAGQWQHVAATIDSVRNITLYVNGTAVATGTAPAATTATTNPLIIGRFSGTYNSFHFSGAIDDARLYNVALSAAEIQALFSAGSGTPTAPGNLTATAVSSSQINLSWTDSNNETQFRIERKTGAGAYSFLANKGANVTTHNDTGLSASTTYTYRVRAENANGNSAWSNEASATTQSSGGALVVSNLSVASDSAYEVLANLENGQLLYIDRTFTYTNVASYAGRTFIRTANDDKNRTETSFLGFSVNQAVTVYVAYDIRATSLPNWLSSWTDTGHIIGTTDVGRRVYAKPFSAGTVTLGGNAATGMAGANSMYSVIIAGSGGAFQESGGEVVIEGEHFHGLDGRTDPNGVNWQIATSIAGAVGGQYVETPGPQGTNGDWTNGCEASYSINFATTGTYNVWVRRYAAGGSANSVSAGLNGVQTSGVDNATDYNAWVWKNLGTVSVTSAGVKTFQLRRREAGYKVDRIVLRTSATAPTGNGPAESPQ